MESLNLPKEIAEAIAACVPCDRDMRHPTAKLVEEAILDDLLIRKLEDLPVHVWTNHVIWKSHS